jgi:AraC-like DNA-binding protein
MAWAGQTPHVLTGHDLLLLVDQEAAQLRCRGKAHVLPPDLVSVVEQGDVVVLKLVQASPCRVLYLAPGLLTDAAASVPNVRGAAAAGRRIAWVMVGRGVCASADQMDSEEAVCRMIERAASTNGCRLRLVAEEQIAHPVVWRARDHLRDGYSVRVTLDDLGGLVGMHRYALARAFTREVGIPPHAYQTYIKVLRARELIASGYSLSDASVAVGFSDQSHLGRYFKRMLGITPGRYARATTKWTRSQASGTPALPTPWSSNALRQNVRARSAVGT